jgi:hypothetical protein
MSSSCPDLMKRYARFMLHAKTVKLLSSFARSGVIYCGARHWKLATLIQQRFSTVAHLTIRAILKHPICPSDERSERQVLIERLEQFRKDGDEKAAEELEARLNLLTSIRADYTQVRVFSMPSVKR